MELVHEFSVPVPVERAWEVLTDVERIAPCMPGAQLTEVDGDTYHGQVKIKVGPITAQYKGTASFSEMDEAARRVVLKANGRDSRGQGNAAATVTTTMTAEGGSTSVHITTDLSISGRVAQFGRGVMGDVSAKLLEQFVRNLEANVLAPDGGGAGGDGGNADGAGVAGSAAAPGSGAAGGAAAAGGPALASTPAPAAAGGPAAAVAPAEAVRPMGLIMRSVMTRTGQAIARFFRRLTGGGSRSTAG